jgi:hypothetical protein
MNEPQSNADAGPASVPDAATTQPATPEPAHSASGTDASGTDASGTDAVEAHAPAEPGIPEDPGGLPADLARDAGDPDTSEDTLAEHVARTDAALVAWRQDAERRRAAWDASQARALEQMRAQRRRVVRFAATTGLIGLGLGFAAGVLFYRTWWLPGATRAAALEPPPSSTAPLPDPAPPDPALPVVEGGGDAAPGGELTPEAFREGAPPKAAPDPGVEVTAAAPVAPLEPPLALVEGSARVWTEGSHTWAAFEAVEPGELSLRYVDGAGQPALEPMECQAAGPDGIRRCAAGRSAARLDAAVAEGAAAGTWTVEACGASGCVAVGTFDVAPVR